MASFFFMIVYLPIMIMLEGVLYCMYLLGYRGPH